MKRRYKEFQIGDEVMVHLKKNHFSVGTYNKLKMKMFGLCKIVKRHDYGNAYEVEFPTKFNILHLTNYYEGDDGDEFVDEYSNN